MKTHVGGIMPVMLTPFTEQNEIDWAGLERLVEWYIGNGADALFAVAQSSEMQFLSLTEREALGRAVVRQVAGRVPVVVSGHISDDIDAQVEELTAAAKTGADAVILVTNHLDPKQTGAASVFLATLDTLLARLPRDVPLGLYECPAPFRRLLSDDELRRCIDTNRFVVLKDVSCDLGTVQRRAAMVEGSPLALVNANAAIAWDAMQAGSRGFCGVHTNYHPDLYKWLMTSGAEHPDLRARLVPFLAMAALSEAYGYPAQAKLFHQRLGTFGSARCRVTDFDVRERFWALDAVLNQLLAGTDLFRAEIARLS
ncbi:MAG: dihydrodipicolinate synthase family protein [Acetobacteraceae bacterium]|nr:dihydrodipicolinate synthase family protein [Acetobacteraceae bacterium]